MKVLNRFKRQNHDAKVSLKKTRKTDIQNAIKCVSLAWAIVGHRNHGHGKVRFERNFRDVLKLMDDYIDRYDGDSLLAALQVKAKEEVGIEIELG